MKRCVQRGGSCEDGTEYLRTTDRCWCGAGWWFSNVGFRVVIRRRKP